VERARRLRQFYFVGLPGFEPVVHKTHYGQNATFSGQIRANLFMGATWILREFKFTHAPGCTAQTCAWSIWPKTNKVNPFPSAFEAANTSAIAVDFRNVFPSLVSTLAINDINRFHYEVPHQFNQGLSDAQHPSFNFVSRFVNGGGAPFTSAIQTQLTAAGSSLTPAQVVARAMTQSCQGCHQLSNGADIGGGLTWPSSLVFVHVSELGASAGPDGGQRFPISPALTGTFLPHRKAVLEAFLQSQAL
jgi:hypothetical protein